MNNITCVITSFRRPEFLWRAYNSAANAGFKNIVISAAGVNDEIRKVVHSAQLIESPKTTFIGLTDDPGCNFTWLSGVKAAKTEWVHILHDDDMVCSMFGGLEMSDSRNFVVFDGGSHSAGGDTLKPHHKLLPIKSGIYDCLELRPHLLREKYSLSPVSGVFKRDFLISVLEEFEKNCAHKKEFTLRPGMSIGNDLLIWLRATELKGTFEYISEPLVSYGNHPESTTVADQKGPKVLPEFYKATKKYWASTLMSEMMAPEDIVPPVEPVITKFPTFTVSVLCLNNLDLTKQCIESIIRHSKDYELIITNNGSTDGTKEYLDSVKQRLGSIATVIHNEENKGFQQPNEDALKLAKGRYLVLFNNDMKACKGWLEGLKRPFDLDPKMAITGIAGTCCQIDPTFKGRPGNDEKPEYIEGGCLMVPVSLVRKHGLFSPYLEFIYWEDTDLSLRMRELGYNIATVKLPITHHHRSATTKHLNLEVCMRKNQSEMWKRWGFYIKRRSLVRNVTVRRSGARGDVLLATPVLAALKAKWPLARISVQTKHPEMLTGIGVFPVAERPSQVDHFYDLDMSYEAEPRVRIVDVYAKACGVTVKDHKPIMVARSLDKAWAETMARGRKVALIHPGPTTWNGKNWPYERFEEVVDHLKSNGYLPIAIGDKGTPLVGCQDAALSESPQRIYALASISSLFVGLDSMPQHIASAANTPSVVLFGETDPRCIVRESDKIIAVQGDKRKTKCIGAHGRRTKPVTHSECIDGACMFSISTSMCIDAIEEVTK